ncbi:zinc ribbon domain-containing protein [bacterium]|nr:zinc ribbon domain-containing protein [bacterium]
MDSTNICLAFVALIIAVASFVSTVYASYLLGKREDKGTLGFLLGFFMGWLGLLIMCMITRDAHSPEGKKTLSPELVSLHSCGACGKPTPATAHFCSNCGQRLNTPRDPSYDTPILSSWNQNSTQNVRCSRCRSASPPGSNFCIHCGQHAG